MSQNYAANEKKSIFSNYVVDGILLIILGVIFLIRPKESLNFFLVVIGIVLLIMGGVTLIMTIIAKKKQASLYANVNPNAYANANPNAYANANPNAYANANPNAYANANPNAYANTNPNAYANTNPNAYANANRNAYANANAYPKGQNAAGGSKLGGFVLAAIEIVVGILLLAIPDFFVNLFPYIAGAGIAIGAVISLVNALKQRKRGNAPLATPTIILSLIGLALGIIVICFAIGGSNVPIMLIGIAMLADGVTLLLAMSKA